MAEEAKELQLKLTTQGAQQAARELENVATAAGKVTEEQKDAAAAAVRALNAPTGGEEIRRILGQTADGSRDAAKGLSQLKEQGENVTKVFRGLQESSEGGTRGILGAATALRGSVGLFKSIGSLLAGPVGFGLGAAAAGIAFLGKKARENQAAIEKVFTEAAAKSDKLKTAYANLEEAGSKSLAKQIADVEKLASAFSTLRGQIDAADKRIAESIKQQTQLKTAQLDRDEQAALGGATTDEAREKIAAKFAQRRTALKDDVANADITNLKRKGLFDLEVANQQRSPLQQQVDVATSDARDKRAAANSARDNSKEIIAEKGIGSAQAREAIASAELAAKAAKIAEENLKKVVAATTAALQQIDAQVDGALANIEKANSGAAIRKIELETETLKARNAAAPELKKLRGASAAAQEAQDFGAQDQANAELSKVEATVKQAAKREKANDAQLDRQLEQQGRARPPGGSDIQIKTIEAQTGFIRKGSAELLAAQQRNAEVMIDFQQRLKAANDKQARQIANRRE